MTSATRTSNPAGPLRPRPFHFDGLAVGQAERGTAPGSGDTGDMGPCDVLVVFDLSGTDPATLAECLAGAGRRIGRDGVLLLAVPNRFGLRFWSGCPEPSTGRLFTTLAGAGALAAPPSPALEAQRFVSRHELSEAIAHAGLFALEWFFAFLDEGEAGAIQTLVSEQLVRAAPGLAAELASSRPSSDHLRPRLDLFPEALVYRELAHAGLFAEFASHFLVAASARSAPAGSMIWPRLRPPAPEIGWHFAAGRREPVATVFALAGSGISVSKRQIAPGATVEPGDFVWMAPECAPLAPGEPLRLRLQEHLLAGGSERFQAEFAEFFAAIRERFGAGELLAEEALDAILTNAVRDEQGFFRLFDLEWRARAGVPASWWILRNVFACIEMRGPGWPGVATGAALYDRLCQSLGISPCLAADLAREAEFAAAVRRAQRSDLESELAAALARPWPVPVALGLGTAELRSTVELASAHEQLIAEYRKLEAWATDLDARLRRGRDAPQP